MIIRSNADSTISIITKNGVITLPNTDLSYNRIFSKLLILNNVNVTVDALRVSTLEVIGKCNIIINNAALNYKLFVDTEEADKTSNIIICGTKLNIGNRHDTYYSTIIKRYIRQAPSTFDSYEKEYDDALLDTATMSHE